MKKEQRKEKREKSILLTPRRSVGLIFFFIFTFFIFNSSFAFDFGLVLNQSAGVEGADSERGFKYSGNMVPRFSGLIGESADYYVSAGIETAYEDDQWSFIPELLRTEFAFRSRALSVNAGRMHHSDPLGLIAAGLFDGARVSYDSTFGSFHAGAWYTGLLYKKRINIEMTADDYKLTNGPLDSGDYAGTYFAPKRLIASLGWEHFTLGGWVSARAAILGQFDLSGGEALNSQYLAGKVTLPFKTFSFDLGGCLQINQQSGEFGTGFAAELGVVYAPPIKLNSRLSLLARYASGSADGGIGAFLPVTTVSQGNILEAKLSGISMISLDYMARLHNTLSAGISSSYFMRSGLKTYGGYPLDGESGDGYFLGNEFFARVLWSPFTDIQVNLGGGIFLPSMGNAAPKAENIWRAELSAVLLIF